MNVWLRCRAVFQLTRVAFFVLSLSLLMRMRFSSLDEADRSRKVTLWSRQLLKRLGITLVVEGQVRPGVKMIVANHVSWLDIMAINAVECSRFVSKAEVGQWPIVGHLVTLGGTIYLERARRRDALRVVGLMAQALREHKVVAAFPEGTTGSGEVLHPFHGNLLQAAIDADVPVQPMALRYRDQHHAISPAAAYVGDTSLVQSLWWIACAPRLTVTVKVLPAHRVTHTDRRALSELLRNEIGQALTQA